MSNTTLPYQDISGTSAADGSIALAGVFPNLTHVGTREANRPPKPSSTVPFRRDPDFVDRGDLLSRIDERCSQPAGRAALVGLGGVGKSQLAIEYTYRARERSPDTWVFWVHASNKTRFEEGFRDIADVVEINGRGDPKANVFILVHKWLRDYEGKWLMILDNADDADFLVNAQAVDQSQSGDPGRQTFRQLRDYLPQSQNGSILITTRNRESALKLAEWNELISVDPMDSSNAVELLNKKLKPTGQKNDKDHEELTALLEFMPLAILQAASYICQLTPQYSARQYIEEFRKNDRKKSSLLNHGAGELRRDGEAKNSIIITLQISFEHIHRTRPSAADLLSLMSFFDRQGIPEALIRTRTARENSHGSLEEDDEHRDDEGRSEGDEEEEEKTDGASVSGSEDDGFTADILTLRNYSFLSAGTDQTFSMHALVQLAIRRWLEAHGRLEVWKELYISILSAKFPSGEYETWTYCEVLFPHVKAALTQRPKAKRSLREWASLLYNAACYAWEKGNITESINLSEMAMKESKNIYGPEHEKILDSMILVAPVYGFGGRWEEAEELAIQTIGICKRTLGEEHGKTARSIDNLVWTYIRQQRWKEAEELSLRAVKISKKIEGEESRITLGYLGNLAVIYENQGLFKKAEELNMQVLEGSKRLLGEEHPDTLSSMFDLASVYLEQRRWKKAEELMVQVLERTLIYWEQGSWKEAEKLYVRVLGIRKRVLGEENPYTLTSMYNLASVYWKQGRWKEAEELLVQVVGIRKRVLGEGHPDTLISMATLADTLRN